MDKSYLDDDTLLTRDMTAVGLTEAGYPVKSKTLATKATRGGGPPYRLFGARPLYRWGDALAWAQERLSAPRRSTSEQGAKAEMASRAPLPAVSEIFPTGVALLKPAKVDGDEQ